MGKKERSSCPSSNGSASGLSNTQFSAQAFVQGGRPALPATLEVLNMESARHRPESCGQGCSILYIDSDQKNAGQGHPHRPWIKHSITKRHHWPQTLCKGSWRLVSGGNVEREDKLVPIRERGKSIQGRRSSEGPWGSVLGLRWAG